MAETTEELREDGDRTPGDRGMAPVNKVRSTQFGKMLIWGLAAATTLVTVFFFDGGVPQPKQEAQGTKPGDAADRGYNDPRNTGLNAGSPPAEPPVFPQFAPPSFPKIEVKGPPPSAGGESDADKVVSPSERRLTGGVSFRKRSARDEEDRSARSAPYRGEGEDAAHHWSNRRVAATGGRPTGQRAESTTAPNPAGRGSDPADNEQIGSPSDGLGAQLKSTKISGVSARRLPTQSLMIARGRLFECVLDTAISSVIAGQVRCTVPLDVYSEDGKVVLLDRLTEIVGEYRSNLRSAQTRLGILWVRAKTPQGVVIDLTSPASDNLGRGGVDGQIDTHFWERFGAAIMLSVLDDALAAAVANSRQNGVFVFGRTQEAGKDAAQIALENSINIPPTLVKNQGETVSVFLARDLDFRSVYDFKQLGVKSDGRQNP